MQKLLGNNYTRNLIQVYNERTSLTYILKITLKEWHAIKTNQSFIYYFVCLTIIFVWIRVLYLRHLESGCRSPEL